MTMKKSADKKSKSRKLLLRYQEGLSKFLQRESSASLKLAPKLGRWAVDCGFETLDMAMIHEEVLQKQIVSLNSVVSRNRVIKRARIFFADAIVPLEQRHRVAQEAIVRLDRLNNVLSMRTKELAESNRHLKQEITKRKTVEKSLRQSEQNIALLLERSRCLQEQLRSLSRGLLSAQEEERRSISRELHDVIAQVLTGINVQLAALKMDVGVGAKGFSKKISRTQRLVENSVDIVHRFARELRPAMLDDLGLIPALHSFMKNFTKETGIRAGLTVFAGVEKLSSSKRTTLYRVAHEALTNVSRHSKASRVNVDIQRVNNTICMEIKDNGQGFELNRVMKVGRNKRLGLIGLRERLEIIGGKFDIKSTPGKGTTITVQIPFRQDARKVTKS